MKRALLTIFAGTVLALWTVVPLVHGQEGFIIQEEVVGPNVKFMSGGVGIEERKAMESQAAKGYDLKLVFAITRGNYLSYVDVKINDKTGKPVISAQANGPWFYADLPKGTYTVVANHEGEQKTQKVTVNGGLQQVIFHWKSDQPAQATIGGEPKAGAAKHKRPGSGKAAKQPQPAQTEKSK